MNLVQSIPFSFAALFPVLNPIGSSFIILSIVNGAPPSQLNRLAYKIAIYTAVMLIVSLSLGSWLLRLFGISIPIVLIGGGLILAYIGWQLLNQPSEIKKNATEAVTEISNLYDMAFYPLTMPITAGPGCIAVVIALGAHNMQASWEETIMGLVGSAIGISLVAVTVYFCYRYTHVIARRLGESGTAVIMRMAAFFNLCIGLELMWHGVSFLLKL